jgi:hypothetical protein
MQPLAQQHMQGGVRLKTLQRSLALKHSAPFAVQCGTKQQRGCSLATPLSTYLWWCFIHHWCLLHTLALGCCHASVTSLILYRGAHRRQRQLHTAQHSTAQVGDTGVKNQARHEYTTLSGVGWGGGAAEAGTTATATVVPQHEHCRHVWP